MICHHVCYPELPKSLAVMTSMYTRIPFYKDMRKTKGREFWRYNAMDVVATAEVQEYLEMEMEEFGVHQFYTEFQHRLIPVLLEMQLRGVRIDLGVREAAIREVGGRIREEQKELEGLVGGGVNVESSKQIQDLLYRKMGLTPRMNRKTKKPTVDKETIEELMAKHPSRTLSLILSLREARDQMSNHLSAPLRDGRMHCSYNIGGRVKDGEGNVVGAPETGRLSSSISNAMESGANLQNVPLGLCRRMFVPDRGKIFVSADLMQAEARYVAQEAGEEKLIQAFLEGDPYVSMAEQIFHIRREEVGRDQRYLAKRMVLALNYMMGVNTFAFFAGISTARARELKEMYFSTYPRVGEWQQAVIREVGKTRVFTTPWGRKRQFFNRWGDELWKEAVAYRPQSSIADLLNMALLKMDDSIRERGRDWQAMLHVHDQFIIQVPEGEEKEAQIAMGEVFAIPIKVQTIQGTIKEFTIPIKVKCGPNWDELEPIGATDDGQG